MPEEAAAGITWRFDIALSDYSPAGGWSLKIQWQGVDKLNLTGVANASNDGWEFTASATDTENLRSGVYQWLGYVEKGAEKYVVGAGNTFVLPNVLTAQPGTLQPYAEKALAYVEAALLSRYKLDQASMMLRQRQLVREEISKLEAARARLQAEIAAQRSASYGLGRRVEWEPKAYL